MWLEKWKVLVICSLAKKNGGLGATHLRDLGGWVVGRGALHQRQTWGALGRVSWLGRLLLSLPVRAPFRVTVATFC